MTFQGTIEDGAEVYGSDGHKIGRVGQVFVLQGTDQPTWIAVQTGLFGMQESFVPVAGASTRGDEVIVAYDKAFVKDAPRIADSDDLTAEQEAELYRYYGVEPPLRAPEAMDDRAHDAHRIDDQPRDERGDERAPGDGRGLADERGQRLGEGEGAAARADHRPGDGVPRLRRRIVTEMQTVQVPVQREEIIVEGEGIASDDDIEQR
jgi:sporulation protein YlmC with PRC-barrel domain